MDSVFYNLNKCLSYSENYEFLLVRVFACVIFPPFTKLEKDWEICWCVIFFVFNDFILSEREKRIILCNKKLIRILSFLKTLIFQKSTKFSSNFQLFFKIIDYYFFRVSRALANIFYRTVVIKQQKEFFQLYSNVQAEPV